MITLSRRYHFSASHRLHSPVLSAAENARIYGKCNNPFGHGHDYTLEVTVAGEPDPESGLIVPLPLLDRFIANDILRLFANRNINLDVPEFRTLVPTTENVALVIAGLLEEGWRSYFNDSRARLVRLHIQETDRNGFELVLGKREVLDVSRLLQEGVTANV